MGEVGWNRVKPRAIGGEGLVKWGIGGTGEDVGILERKRGSRQKSKELGEKMSATGSERKLPRSGKPGMRREEGKGGDNNVGGEAF
jgi:hypothetical protein